VKTSERHQRNVSQRQINLSDRDERLQKIVTDYHMKIDDQVQQRQSQGRLNTTLKKTMRNEWVSVTSDNQ
jgi:predicted N-formylglutamate amidohydrolase